MYHKVASALCFFSQKEAVIVTQLLFKFFDYYIIEKKLRSALLNIFELPDLIPQSIILSFLDLNY